MSALRALRPTRPGHQAGSERRITALVRALLLFESAMYSAVTPVLPHYARTLGASKPAVGLLAAAYPAGILPGSLLAAWMASRVGVKRTSLVGLFLFAASIVAFGFGSDIVTLDALRFVQGAACGFIWGGGLTWVIAVVPRERRGGMLGSVIGAATFGTLLGPILGTLAVAAGTQIVFSLVGAASLGLAAWTMRYPEPSPAEPGTSTPLRAVARNPAILLGGWLILLEACTVGATGTLLPLRLARFDAPGWAIGATFVLASLLSAGLSPRVGRLVDRRGARLPLCAGLAATALLLAVLPLPHTWLALAAVSGIALGGPLTAYTIPAMSVITESAERAGIALVVATTLLNLAWATGETIGAPAAAGISQATSDAVPLLILAAIMLATLVVVRRRLASRMRPAGAAPVGPEAAPRPAAPAEPPAPAGSERLQPDRPQQGERVRVG
jgi:MFS family permease